MLHSRRHATAAIATIAMLTTGEHAVAQSTSELETRLEAGATTSSHVGSIPLSAFALTPGFRYASPRMTASARASALLGLSQWQLGNSAAALEAYTPLLYGVRAEVAANASRLFHDQSVQNDQLDAEGRLHFMRQRAGIWLGSGVARPLRVAAVSNVNVSSGGVWTRVGAATLRGSVTSFFFTKIAFDDTLVDNSPAVCSTRLAAPTGASGPTGMRALVAEAAVGNACRHQSRLTDLEGTVRWEHKLGELTLRGGQRFGDRLDVNSDSRHWASAQAAVWITNQIAAVAGGGREPAQPTRGLPARSFGSVGLMLAYWPIPRGNVLVETPASLVHSFEVRAAGTALQRLTARIGGVETVEIMGDFTDWSPVPLIRRGRDAWELLVPMSPGVHQINIRIDGGQWIAPPGVPSLKDGFNGEVGVLVVNP
ncbi:MAG TPA: glycogen-binding domain-containing protein [Gemmatimonadaceae bacterium]|nr:glycogen-binding domain-containing protein [Gemmatimonadaceae bacterium]